MSAPDLCCKHGGMKLRADTELRAKMKERSSERRRLGHPLRYLRAPRVATTARQRCFLTCYGTKLTSTPNRTN